jgi:hypothetical protein
MKCKVTEEDLGRNYQPMEAEVSEENLASFFPTLLSLSPRDSVRIAVSVHRTRPQDLTYLPFLWGPVKGLAC